MLELLDTSDSDPEAARRIIEGLNRQAQAVLASAGRGDRSLVARAEAEVRSEPKRAIVLDGTFDATVRAAGRTWRGGRFETPSLGELQRRAGAARRGDQGEAHLRLWLLEGSSPVTDIGALQAFAPPGTMFQVASQFNCLESPEPRVVPVADYFRDPTQGPRAAISAFPGALVRHYAAPSPGGGRFVQDSDRQQLNLLASLCHPGIALVHTGYLTPTEVLDPPAFARALEERFDAIRVGVHDNVEVVLGYDWDGEVPRPHTVAQVFASTLATGMYGHVPEGEESFATIVQQLLRAAYLGTLLAATALGCKRVVLTVVGGGAFANPLGTICEAILWAADRVTPLLAHDLTVVVNARGLGDSPGADRLRAATQAHGGGIVHSEHARAAFRHA